jgi:polysaccharide biosynthesis/export protein
VRPGSPPGALFDASATPPAGRNGDIQQVDYQFAAGGQPQSLRVDLAGAAPTLADYHLGDRDMVMVQPREKEMIFVTGLVTKPGQFELPAKHDVRLLDAVAMAGGTSVPVADKVLVIRRQGSRPEPVPIEASLSDAKRNGRENLLLGAGDVVSVEQTPATAMVDTFMKLFRVSVGMASNTTLF